MTLKPTKPITATMTTTIAISTGPCPLLLSFILRSISCSFCRRLNCLDQILECFFVCLKSIYLTVQRISEGKYIGFALLLAAVKFTGPCFCRVVGIMKRLALGLYIGQKLVIVWHIQVFVLHKGLNPFSDFVKNLQSFLGAFGYAFHALFEAFSSIFAGLLPGFLHLLFGCCLFLGCF